MYYMAGERHAALYAESYKANAANCSQERAKAIALGLAKGRVRILGIVGVRAVLYQAGFLKGLGL